MRISLFSPFHGTIQGGIERHADDLARALRARGHEVTVASSAGSRAGAGVDWVLFEGIDRRALWRWRNRPVPPGTRVGVFVHGTFLPLARGSELRERGWTPTPGEIARRLFDRMATARCLAAADRLFVLSRSEAVDLTRVFPALRDRVEVVPMVLQARDRTPGDDRPSGAPYVTAVSRVDRRKNFSTVVEALAGTDIGFRLAGHDHGDVPRIRRAARKAGYGGFEFLGPLDDSTARTLMRGAVATVLPSYFEGVPYMIYQSLAQGTPSLCTDLCYVDPLPGVELRRPSPDGWRELLRGWEHGGRPGTGLPPGTSAWDPLYQTLEGSAR